MRLHFPLLVLLSIFISVTLSYKELRAETGALFQNGDLAVSGFSGVNVPENPASLPAGTSVLDETFIDLNGPSLRVFAAPSGAAEGQADTVKPKLEIPARSVGQVFGVALDDAEAPNIYAAATSVFGLQVVIPDTDGDGRPERIRVGSPGAGWMEGQWGQGGGPGTIWKIDGLSGEVSLFANVETDGQPNSGAALGDLAFDPVHRQLLVSDLDTGLIHRFDLDGNDLGTFDHGVTARPALELDPVEHDPNNRLDIASSNFDAEAPESWGIAEPRRRVWALSVYRGRLYYSVADKGQVWSIGLDRNGSFGADPRFELELEPAAAGRSITNITFTASGRMILAQRGGLQPRYDYSRFHAPRNNRVLSYSIEWPANPQTPGRWLPRANEYAIGFQGNHRNASGGVGVSCGGTLWATGDALRDNPVYASKLAEGGAANIHGLQGVDNELVRPENVPPWQSRFIDLDGRYDDVSEAGHVGDVEVVRQCEGHRVDAPPSFPPISCPDPDSPYCPRDDIYPDLEIVKVATQSKCDAGENCDFLIEVRNKGDVLYFGPLWVDDDAFGGSLVGFGPFPWTCGPPGPGGFGCWHPDVTLFPGDAIWLKVKVKIPGWWTKPAYENCARIDWPFWNGDADSANDHSCDYVPICAKDDAGCGPDLLVTKRRLQSRCDDAGYCRFRVEVTNVGADTFTGKIRLRDEIAPFGIKLNNYGPKPDWQCGLGLGPKICEHKFVTLNPGDSVKLNLRHKVPDWWKNSNQVRTVRDCARTQKPVPGSSKNADPFNDKACAYIKYCPQGVDNCSYDLAVTKAAQKTFCKPGDNCFFVIKTENVGSGPFEGQLTISDPDPVPGATLVSNTPSWVCAQGGGETVCKRQNVNLAPGDTIDLSLTFNIPANINAAVIKNCGKLSWPPGKSDGNPANDEGCTTLPTGLDDLDAPLADLAIKIVAASNACVKGQNCAFDIAASNNGPGNFPGVPSFRTTVPDGLIFQGLALQSQWQCQENGSQVSCVLPTGGAPVTPSDFGIVRFNYRVDPAFGGSSISNTVTIDSDASIDPDSANNSSTATVQILDPGPGANGLDLSINKFNIPGCVQGEECEFGIRVKNESQSPFSGMLVIDDVLPEGVELVAEPGSGGWQCSRNAQTQNERRCRLSVSNMLPQSETVIARFKYKQTSEGEVTNCAALFEPLNDPTPSNNTSCITLGAQAQDVDPDVAGADLKVEKFAAPDAPACAVGDVCRFEIKIENVGTATFSGDLPIYDILPRGMELVTPPAAPWVCENDSSAFVCTRPGANLAPGETLTASAEAKLTAAGQVENCAGLPVEIRELDQNSANDKGCTLFGAPADEPGGKPVPDLIIEKFHEEGSENCPVGQTCRFGIRIRTAGQDTYTGPLRFIDRLPAGGALEITGISAGSWSCADYEVALDCWKNLSSIGITSTAWFSYRLKVAGQVENCADIYNEPRDARISNNTSCIMLGAPADTPQGGALDLELTKTADQNTCQLDQPCNFTVSIKNHQPGQFAQDVIFIDTARQLVPLVPLGIASVQSEQTLCQRAQLPMNCTSRLTLAAGRTMKFGMSFRIGDASDGAQLRPGAVVENCATLVFRNAQDEQVRAQSCAQVKIAGGDEQPPAAQNQPRIALDKSGPAFVRPGEVVVVELKLRNEGETPANGPFDLRELFSAPPLPNTVQILSTSPDLACSPPLQGAPHSCSVMLNLPAGEVKTHRLRIQMPDEMPRPHRGLSCTGIAPQGTIAEEIDVDRISSGKIALKGDGYACWAFNVPESQFDNVRQEENPQPPPEEENPICTNGMEMRQDGVCSCPDDRPWNGLYCGGGSQPQDQSEPDTDGLPCSRGMQFSEDGTCSCPADRPWNGLYCGGGTAEREPEEPGIEIEGEQLDPACGWGMVRTPEGSCSCPASRPWNGHYCGGTPERTPADDTAGGNIGFALAKTARSTECSINGYCTFDISIRNVSGALFRQENVTQADVMLHDGIGKRFPVAETDGRACAASHTLPFVCNSTLRIEAGAERRHYISIRPGDNPDVQVGDTLENCYELKFDNEQGERVTHRSCASVRVTDGEAGQLPNRLRLTKTARSATCELGGNCTFDFAIQNVSNTPVEDYLVFMFDTVRDGALTAIFEDVPIVETDQTFNCTGVATLPLPYQSPCSKTLNLEPGETHSFSMTIRLDNIPDTMVGRNLFNCSRLTHRYTNIWNRSCASVLVTERTSPPRSEAQFPPPNLSISKRPVQSDCQSGRQCSFNIDVKNSSFAPYRGPIVISDQISPRGARLISAGPAPWSCSGGGGTYTCQTPNLRLDAGASARLRLTFAVPRGTGENVDNCAAIVWRSEAEDRLRTTAVQAALGKLGFDPGGVDGIAGPGTARAVTLFQSSNDLRATGRLDQGLIRRLFGNWTRGDGNGSDDRDCARVRLKVKSIPIACPSGQVLSGGKCVPSGRACRTPFVRIDGECRCRAGLEPWRGKCVRPCTGDLSRSETGRCVCPAGFSQRGSRCIERPDCKPGTKLDPSGRRCVPVCRSGERWNGRICIPQCAAGTSWDPDRRRCVRDCRIHQRWDGQRCVSRCRTGQRWDGQQCVSRCKPGTRFNESSGRCISNCKPSQRWDGRRCANRCKRGERWNGQRCVGVCRPGTSFDAKRNRCVSVCTRGERWDGQRCVSSCRKGQRWDGRKCVSRCGRGQVLRGGQCVCRSGLVKLGNRCIRQVKCGRGQVAKGNRCVCRPGLVPQGRNRCVRRAKCGRGQVLRGNRCVCRPGLVKRGNRCVRRPSANQGQRNCTGGAFLDRRTGRCTCGRNNRWDRARRRCVPL